MEREKVVYVAPAPLYPLRVLPTEEAKPDLSIHCPLCLEEMIPVHAHYQCERCHYRDSCCG